MGVAQFLFNFFFFVEIFIIFFRNDFSLLFRFIFFFLFLLRLIFYFFLPSDIDNKILVLIVICHHIFEIVHILNYCQFSININKRYFKIFLYLQQVFYGSLEIYVALFQKIEGNFLLIKRQD